MTSLRSRSNNLPAQVSSFIGRERELEEIARLLHLHRLVTLTGPGGTGKTRLAFQAVAASLDEFNDGAWLVELAPLTTAEFVIGAIAKVVGAPETSADSPLDSLGSFLREKRLLLVLDNCEHVLGECAHVGAYLLAHCPSLVVFATSREPLTIVGEVILRVPPLGLPEPSQPVDWQRLLDYDGVRLFVERAHAAEPSFQFSSVTAAGVAEICRQLDGIPLALELAAVRVRGMGVAYLGARLGDRFRLLQGGNRSREPRQQTLLALVDWSFSLLTDRERVVLRRVCVFNGSFSAEAAETFCAGAYDNAAGQATVSAAAALDDVTRLVDKSLIQLDHETGRYRLLETIRLYGLDKLAEAGEVNHLSRQHFVYFLRLAEEGASYIGGPAEEGWFTTLEQEHDNIRAALAWAIRAGRADEAARLALGVWKFWQARTMQREGIRWIEQILALEETNQLPADLRPLLLNAFGVLAQRLHYFDRARACHAEALRLWVAADYHPGIAQAQLDIGWQHWDEVELAEAAQCATKCLAIAESLGDKRLIAGAMYLSALVGTHIGQLDEAIPALERCVLIWRELGDRDSIASTIAVLATAYQQRGDYERAKPLLAESARLQIRTGSSSLTGTLVGLMFLATNTARQPEQTRDAVRMLGALIAWDEATSAEPSPWHTSEATQRGIENFTRVLGPEGFAQAYAEGKNLTTADLLSLIDRITAPGSEAIFSASVPPAAPHDALTPRELEVLRLVAQGLTNAQVAQELTVTPRTVNAHLTATYGKLGVTSRSGAIRYAVDHQIG